MHAWRFNMLEGRPFGVLGSVGGIVQHPGEVAEKKARVLLVDTRRRERTVAATESGVNFLIKNLFNFNWGYSRFL